MMKSLLLAVLACTAPFFSIAQFSKGDKVLSGSINATIFRSPQSAVDGFEVRSNSLSVSPHLGFFITERMLLGGGISYESSFTRAYQDGSPVYLNESRGVGFTFTARRYSTITEGLLFSISASASYRTGNFRQSSSEDKIKFSSGGINLSPSFHFFPTRHWAVEGGIGSIGYNTSVQKDMDKKSNNFNFGLGTFIFGLAYYFRE